MSLHWAITLLILVLGPHSVAFKSLLLTLCSGIMVGRAQRTIGGTEDGIRVICVQVKCPTAMLWLWPYTRRATQTRQRDKFIRRLVIPALQGSQQRKKRRLSNCRKCLQKTRPTGLGMNRAHGHLGVRLTGKVSKLPEGQETSSWIHTWASLNCQAWPTMKELPRNSSPV